MSERPLCEVCGERKVMRGESASAKRAQRVNLCHRCFREPAVYRKQAAAMGLSVRAPKGSGKGRKARTARPPRKARRATPAQLGRLVEAVCGEVDHLAACFNATAEAVDGASALAEESLETLKVMNAQYDERMAQSRQALTESEDRLRAAVERFRDRVPQDPPDPWPEPVEADVTLPGTPRQEKPA